MPSTETLLKYHQYQANTNDCAPFTVATVINAIRDQALIEGAVVAREMNRPRLHRWGPLSLPVVRRIPNSATFPWGIADELGRNGIACRWRFGAQVKILAAFHPNCRAGLIDAAHPKAEIMWQNESVFKRLWRNFGNLLIATIYHEWHEWSE